MGKKKVKSMVYYDLLSVEVDATPEQIKKAYRKKALQLHPDKRGNTPEAQEEFTRMKQAYDVLSDPQKREVYDQAGVDGIKLMENYGSMGPEELAAALFASLGAFGPKGKCLLILIISSLFSFFLIIPIFWCLRVDQTINWSWVVVFTPLWVLDTIYYCCYGCAMISSDASIDPEEHKRQPLIYRLYRLLKSLLLLVLQVFIAMKLNGDLNWSVIEVFLPYFVYDTLSFIETCVGGIIGYQMLTKQSEGAGVSATEAIQHQRRALIGNVLVQLLIIVSRLTQGVLIALQVDNKLGNSSWWAVFTPVWLFVLYFCSHPVRRYFRVRAKLKQDARNPKPSSSQAQHDAYTRDSVHDDEDEEGSKNPLADALCSIVFIAVVSSPYFILTARLQDATFSTLYILLPWFVIVGLILCFICCAIACIGVVREEDDDFTNEDVKNPNHDNGADYTAMEDP